MIMKDDDKTKQKRSIRDYCIKMKLSNVIHF